MTTCLHCGEDIEQTTPYGVWVIDTTARGAEVCADNNGPEFFGHVPVLVETTIYRVRWDIDVEVLTIDGAPEAAREARRIHLDPESSAGIFSVQAWDGYDPPDMTAADVIDLDDPDFQPADAIGHDREETTQ